MEELSEYQIRDKAKADIYLESAEAIRESLGASWEIERNGEFQAKPIFKYKGANVFIMSFADSYGIKQGRIVLRSYPPRALYNYETHKHGIKYSHEISLSLSKHPDKIAQDINRRLLPECAEIEAQMQDDLDKHNERTSAVQDNIKRIMATGIFTKHIDESATDKTEYRLHDTGKFDGYGHIRVTDSYFTLDLRMSNIDQVIKICESLK